MSATLVVGTQWGDEGKAKVIDYLSEKIDIIARYQGGANAGHTVKVGDETYIFHLIPSGILYPSTVCVIGNGVVLDPNAFREELDYLTKRNIAGLDRIIISDACHLVLPLHRQIDAAREKAAESKGNSIGTTKRGIGMCYADKIMRIGLRLGDLYQPDAKDRVKRLIDVKNQELNALYGLDPADFNTVYGELEKFAEEVRPCVRNTSYYLNEELKQGKRLLLEGAQGTALDIDFGTYPYVTSSNPTTGGALCGTGISFQHLEEVYGICKAYVTRVGEGPFPTELHGEEAEKLREIGHEFGATTGRPRRCGWFDTELAKHAARVNGLTALVLTKIDVLSAYDRIPLAVGYEIDGQKQESFPSSGLERSKPVYEYHDGWKTDITGARRYNDLPQACRNYIERIEEVTGVQVKVISVGPEREQTIIK